MLESKGLTIGQIQSMPQAGMVTRVYIYRKRLVTQTDGNSAPLGNPSYTWVQIAAGWPVTIAEKHADLLAPPIGPFGRAMLKLISQYRMLPDGPGVCKELIIQTRDVLFDPRTNKQWLVVNSHDPGFLRAQIIADIEEGVVGQDLTQLA